MYGVKISATGSYLPPDTITNANLEKTLDTTNEWIVQRCGIKSRHICTVDDNSLTMGVKAAQDLIEKNNVDV